MSVRTLNLWIGVLAATPCAAQVTGDKATPTPPQDQVTIVTETAYREARSLALFEACDANADDRLDVFEFGVAFVDLENPRDPTMFRRADKDASGFVEWNEFDARLRDLFERAARVRIRPVHPIVDVRDPSTSPPAADPTEQIIGQFDVDHDGLMSPSEFNAFVRRAELEPNVAERFPQLDTDGSGTLSPGEFGRVLMFAPAIWQRIAPHEQEIRSMPDQFRALDFNLDGAIDQTELEVGLRRIHPALANWTQRILFDADRSHEKTLGWSELAAATALARRRLEQSTEKK